jgi:DNA invertase Pin-like site-specific DNA recombinase
LSGKDTNRPKLQELLSEINKNDIVIVATLSRLSRNTLDALSMLEQFKSKNVRFVCLSPSIDVTTPIGELIFTLLASVSKMERQSELTTTFVCR